MEAEKLQRLHDTLQKLAPRGKVGGLGYNSFAKQARNKKNDLPDNALYSRFVRAGTYKKTTFSDSDDDKPHSDKIKDKKRKKKDKKEKKSKKEMIKEPHSSNCEVNGRESSDKEELQKSSSLEKTHESTKLPKEKSKKSKDAGYNSRKSDLCDDTIVKKEKSNKKEKKSKRDRAIESNSTDCKSSGDKDKCVSEISTVEAKIVLKKEKKSKKKNVSENDMVNEIEKPKEQCELKKRNKSKAKGSSSRSDTMNDANCTNEITRIKVNDLEKKRKIEASEDIASTSSKKKKKKK